MVILLYHCLYVTSSECEENTDQSSLNGNAGRWNNNAAIGVNFTNPSVKSSNALALRVQNKRKHSVSPTKFCPTLQVHTTIGYPQPVCPMLYARHHKDQQKFIGARTAHKMMMKLTQVALIYIRKSCEHNFNYHMR